MEDRYLFKAKRLDNGEWVQGNLIQSCDATDGWGSIIIPVKNSNMFTKHIGQGYGNLGFENWYRVNPSTICQCTGLKDKNGNLIWENDIVRFKHEKFDFDDGLESFERTCLPNKKEHKRNYVVEFCNTPTHYGLRFRNGSIWFMVHKMTIVMHDTEVIGNVFDNPELLESEG
nr:MAG TPA: YopX protein [Bacteriophage sp.]